MHYTFILKDTLLPRSDNGREQATASWEYDFSVCFPFNTGETLLIRIPFTKFKPTYRGRVKEDAEALQKSSIRRMSFMVRR